MSHPAMGEWIEMAINDAMVKFEEVAPRKGCVD